VEELESCKWVIIEGPLGLLNLLSAIDQLVGLMQDLANKAEYDPTIENVRLTGKAIGKSLVDQMKKHNLQLPKCFGCGFDGAAAMSSERVGAAAVVKGEAPLADYFHCTMHSFNLAVAQSLKIPDIRHCLDCIQETVSFFSFSAKRTLCLENVIKFRAPDSKRTRLVGLCSTRFIERHTAVLVFSELLEFTVEALQGMSHWESADTRRNATQLLHSILTPQFIIYALVLLESVTALMH